MARRTLAAALLVLALATAAGCGGKKSSSPPASTTTTGVTSGGTSLQGSVGPGFDISLTLDGHAVSSLTPGTYTLTVDDEADIHNFHLTGPGVDVSTGVSEKGTKTFTITLEDGSYHFQCDPHASSMKGDFTVSG
jgi:plastocyanin